MPAHLRGRIIAVFALLNGITLFVVVTASGAILIAGLIVFGITISCFLPLLLLLLMDMPEVGSAHMGSAGGMLFCVAEIGGFTGPFLMGALVDMTGAFLVGASFLAGLNILILIMALLLKSQPASGPKAPAFS